MTRERGGRPCPAIASLALLAALGAVLGACASGGDERARRAAELADLRGQVEDLRRGQDAAARDRAKLAEQLKALDAQQAFVLADVKTSREELGRMGKTLEQSESALAGLRAAVEEAQRKAAAPPPPLPDPASRPAAATARDVSPDKLYALALASFRAEEHEQAVREFGELVDQFPRHPLASNAQYWIGEAYYRQRDFSRAAAEFQKVVDEYPQSAQVPEALLKLGLCHRALKDTAAARASWERVVKGYAGTNAAAQARSLLSQLGGQGRGTR